MPPTDPLVRFSNINRLAMVWLVASTVLGPVVGMFVLWFGSPESAVAAGVGSTAVGWGFLGSLSWLTAASAERAERAVAQASLRRRMLTGRAEPRRGAVGLVDAGAPEGSLAPSIRTATAEARRAPE